MSSVNTGVTSNPLCSPAKPVLAGGLVSSINFALDAKRNAAKTQWTAYTLGITAARSTIATDPTRAARDLDALPESLRNWEWFHLYRQLDSSVARCAGEETISSVAFLADGTPVAALIQSGAVILVDVKTGETLKDFGPAPNLAFLNLSADGAWLGGFDPERQEISIWDVTEGGLVNRIPIQLDGGFISGFRFSPTGRLCCILGEGRSGVIDVQSGQFSSLQMPSLPASWIRLLLSCWAMESV